MDFNSVAAELIATLREDSGKTQSDIARTLGITQSTVSKLERGEITPNLGELRRFCMAMDIDFPVFAQMLESKFLAADRGL